MREPLVLSEAAQAARRIARAEDRLLFAGSPAAGVRGLLEHEGAVEVAPGDWSDPGRAADDLLGVLAQLEAAGGHGPFAVAVVAGALLSAPAAAPRHARSRRTSSSSPPSRAAS